MSYIADDNGFRVLSDSRLENIDAFGLDATASPIADLE